MLETLRGDRKFRSAMPKAASTTMRMISDATCGVRAIDGQRAAPRLVSLSVMLVIRGPSGESPRPAGAGSVSHCFLL